MDKILLKAGFATKQQINQDLPYETFRHKTIGKKTYYSLSDVYVYLFLKNPIFISEIKSTIVDFYGIRVIPMKSIAKVFGKTLNIAILLSCNIPVYPGQLVDLDEFLLNKDKVLFYYFMVVGREGKNLILAKRQSQ